MFSPNFDDSCLTVIWGSMFSEKTTSLIRLLRIARIANINQMVFKPAIDVRYGLQNIATHNGEEFPAWVIHQSVEILGRIGPKVKLVAIDEAQFLDSELVGVVETLLERDCNVVVAGLNLNYRGQPFGPMGQLIPRADISTRLYGVCSVCKGAATHTQRLVNDGFHWIPAPWDADEIVVGNDTGIREKYTARCRKHWEIERPGL